jgi:outer membrane protein OmpA-like peptidoglycan-associated protein
MKKTLMCATAAAAFASAGFVAHAEDGWYARADATFGFDGKLDHDPAEQDVIGTMGSESDPDDMIGFDLGLGYGFDNGFRIEGVGAYGDAELSVPAASYNGAPIGAVPGASGNLQTMELMFNGIYDFNRDGAVQPYVGLGVGVLRANAKANNLVYTNGTDISAANGFADSDTGFAYQGLLGLGYKVSEKLTLDLGYRYKVAEDLEFGGAHGGTNYDADYTAHLATVGMRFNFGATPPPPTTTTDAPEVVCSSLNQEFVVYFEWDRADLTSQAAAVIDQAVANINGEAGCAPNTVSIAGHTDTSGASAYNQRLSQRRANVVANALAARGIEPSIITEEAKGETDLAKATRDGVREPLNRRSEVVITVQ